MLKDIKIIQAVSTISQRAERQRDLNKIIDSYVEVGILPQLLNNNNQILFGRRGTGKTHILRFFESQLKDDINKCVCYIDCRFLGSSPQFTDKNLSIEHRCSSLFIDVLNELYSVLLNHIVYNPNDNSELALNSLDSLLNNSIEQVQKGKKIVKKERSLKEDESGGEFKLSSKDVGLTLRDRLKSNSENENSVEFNVEDFDKIQFPDIHFYLKKVLNEAETDLTIIFDEWSSIPIDIQPFLAEFLKKSFMPISEVVIKIGALEYRSNFTIPRERHNYIGFELGSDISSNLDIDEYFVYDRNPIQITKTFAEILYRHITTELPTSYLNTNFKISTPNQFILSLFTGKPAFSELVRASEGVIRDFINIFSLAFFDSQRKMNKKIDKKIIIESSRQWFENDKSKNLDNVLHEKIRKIIDEVIGKKKARSFLVSRELEKNEVIQKLFDARVIHLVKKGYSDKDNPGIRYNVYTLDYGTYVDLINTSREPQLEFEFRDVEADDFIVPFDDKRSIRRIILTKDILDS